MMHKNGWTGPIKYVESVTETENETSYAVADDCPCSGTGTCYCSNCGSKMAMSSNFCSKCGQRME